MFRIATYYESQLGRNDGNPLYVTAFLKRTQYFCDVKLKRNENTKLRPSFPGGVVYDPIAEKFADWCLENLDPEGIEVIHLRPYGDLKPYGEFDLHIWVDWGEDALKGVLPYEYALPQGPGVKVYWASDTHLGYNYRMATAKLFDIAFVAQKKAVADFAKDGVSATWLPHAFEPLAYPKTDFASKKYDLAFVGHINSENRMEALDRMFREFPNFFFGKRLFNEAAEVYNRSKIVFNIAMKEDLNMRCFEVMGSGSFLLTDHLADIDELFTVGKHLETWTTLDEAVEKAKFYIKTPEAREKIVEAGYEEVMKKHTIGHRVQKMFEAVKEFNKEKFNVSTIH